MNNEHEQAREDKLREDANYQDRPDPALTIAEEKLLLIDELMDIQTAKWALVDLVAFCDEETAVRVVYLIRSWINPEAEVPSKPERVELITKLLNAIERGIEL